MAHYYHDDTFSNRFGIAAWIRDNHTWRYDWRTTLEF